MTTVPRFLVSLVALAAAGCGPAVAPSGALAPAHPELPRVIRLVEEVLTVVDAPRPSFDARPAYRVGVVRARTPNVLALGDGAFAVTDGLVSHLADDELRAVLAHAIAHETLGHRPGAGPSPGIAPTFNVLYLLMGAYHPRVAPLHGLDAGLPPGPARRGYAAVLEEEADRQALIYLARLGHPAEHLRRALATLQGLPGGEPDGFFATHPASAERLAAIQDLGRSRRTAAWFALASSPTEVLVAQTPPFDFLEGAETDDDARERMQTYLPPEALRYVTAGQVPYYLPSGEVLLSLHYAEGVPSQPRRIVVRDPAGTALGEIRGPDGSLDVLTADGQRIGVMTPATGNGQTIGHDLHDLAGRVVAKIRVSDDRSFRLYAVPAGRR
jgi:hypothetical protein